VRCSRTGSPSSCSSRSSSWRRSGSSSGSNESKRLGDAGLETKGQQRIVSAASAGSPLWARVDDWRTRVYEHSLLIDLIVLKRRYSAFDETPLASLIEERGVGKLTIAGTATEMCVFQTAMDALRQGFEVEVQADACAMSTRSTRLSRCPISSTYSGCRSGDAPSYA
jgi:nicotinamidase-related amidase